MHGGAKESCEVKWKNKNPESDLVSFHIHYLITFLMVSDDPYRGSFVRNKYKLDKEEVWSDHLDLAKRLKIYRKMSLNI